jgi:hypothetical protein
LLGDRTNHVTVLLGYRQLKYGPDLTVEIKGNQFLFLCAGRHAFGNLIYNLSQLSHDLSQLGGLPAAYASKTRRTIPAAISLILRSPASKVPHYARDCCPFKSKAELLRGVIPCLLGKLIRPFFVERFRTSQTAFV